MKASVRICSVALAAAVTLSPVFAARPLQIYFIDVEGGQSTLVVTPAGQSLLIDTGFPGDGGFTSHPGDPRLARDANRILAAARDAGVAGIDFLLITHFHADHVGGVTELAQLMPIGAFIDHGDVRPEAESVGGTVQAFGWYAAVRAKRRHINPKPGDRLPLAGLEAVVVSAAGATLAGPLSGAGQRNPACRVSMPPQEPNENPRSTGVRLQFGKFRFLDLGDLTGAPLFALACPNNLVGPVDVYLVAHHGGADAADPAMFAAFRPRVAIVDNGPLKGGAPALLSALRSVAGLEDSWQLHRSLQPGAQDVAEDLIGNLDETSSHWIKVSAKEDGSFVVTNGRTGMTKRYAAR